MLIIVLVILIVVVFKLFDVMLIAPYVHAAVNTLTITDKDPPPNSGIAITVQDTNSTQCFKTTK